MHVADFIESHKEQIIERWKRFAEERLALRLEDSQLVNELPEFVDGLVSALRIPSERWPPLEGARKHGTQRMRIGVDIGGLTAEMALVGEAIITVAQEQQKPLAAADMSLLMRALSHGTSTSVKAYASARDKETAKQTARHFSFVAHELRTPLHNARLAAELLAATVAAPDATKHVGRLMRSLDQLADLVDNSLLDARLQGDTELHVERLQGRELVEAACEAVTIQAEAHGQEVVTTIEPFELQADRKLIVSALTNLLKNAVKFSCNGGRVIVRGRTNGNRALLEVEDQCGGMPEDLPPRLFEPFVQTGKDRSGFGLGLMIVKQAVEAHDGAVRLNNFPGRGCCFVIDLPLVQPEPGADS